MRPGGPPPWGTGWGKCHPHPSLSTVPAWADPHVSLGARWIWVEPPQPPGRTVINMCAHPVLPSPSQAPALAAGITPEPRSSLYFRGSKLIQRLHSTPATAEARIQDQDRV